MMVGGSVITEMGTDGGLLPLGFPVSDKSVLLSGH
jgi:hypothetical protein